MKIKINNRRRGEIKEKKKWLEKMETEKGEEDKNGESEKQKTLRKSRTEKMKNKNWKRRRGKIVQRKNEN